MGIEIERKFLVVGDAWRAQASRRQRMAQGYLNDAASMQAGTQKASMRVRVAGEQAALNLKSRELGASRQEFEYAIPLADAEALLALCVGGTIDKTRHDVTVGAHLWEVDEFHGENAGLVVAEIELGAVDEAFERPAWLGAEVTEHARYYNLALSARPFAAWTDEEKHAC
ncbi:MAG: CYTH domain-containing protein [Lysobacteraceae bacterium]|jgi:adenylate cyclase|nr:CYTH domain-containing protein [Xanthomonadaceae bacterium]MCZ8318212.1 CYTH domain-containing protein [Silanimonas sp.]